MKCERCGKGIGITRRGQAIADGYICYKCLDELGFDKSKRGVKRWEYAYWDIKDGPTRINYNRAKRKGRHKDWLEKHPEVTAFIDALDEEAGEIAENQDFSEESEDSE